MANVWSMAKPTRKCILAGDIIYAFDRKVSSRTFDSLGRTFDSSGECLASLRSAKQLSPSESKVRPRESKVLLLTFLSQSKWCHPLGTIITWGDISRQAPIQGTRSSPIILRYMEVFLYEAIFFTVSRQTADTGRVSVNPITSIFTYYKSSTYK